MNKAKEFLEEFGNKWDGHLENYELNAGTKRFVEIEGNQLKVAARVGDTHIAFAYEDDVELINQPALKAIVDGGGVIHFYKSQKRVEVTFPCKIKRK